MYYKSLITTIILVILTINCSRVKNFTYYPNINQGNYFSTAHIAKIQKGMTQEQIIYILGTPVLKNPFSQQIWHYICHQQLGNQKTKEQKLTLTFNNDGILTNIDIKITS